MPNALTIVVVIVVMLFGALIVGTIHNANKLMFGVPWLKWLTLEEIVEMGHSRLWARLLLPIFYEKKCIEIRISEQSSKRERLEAESRGFQPATVEFYEYKFTRVWKRGKKVPIKAPVPELQPFSV